jgi:membrane protease YdiL (CAAX protease family)
MQAKKRITTIAKIALAAIAVVSFANFFNLYIGDIGFAGIAIIIGVVSFFVVKIYEKQPFEGSGFNIRAIPENLKDKKTWFWMLSPILWAAISLPIAINLLPDAITHDLSRAMPYITYDSTAVAIVMLFVLALGEEIAMRSFFQNQLSRVMPAGPAILITSAIFTVGHFASGNVLSVSFNLLSVFVLSVLYGIAFHKAQNGWISAFAHFISNLLTLIVYGFIR